MTLSQDQRIAGILVPIFALRGPNDLGIGDTAALREFVDFAASLGFSLVKILPINETGNDNSPYNAISSVAVDPTTIHTAPDALPDLRQEDYDSVIKEVDQAKLTAGTVDYEFVKPLKRRLLELAFASFARRHPGRKTERARTFADFMEAESAWLEDYTLFRALMEQHGGSERWDLWPEEQRDAQRARAWLASQSRRAQDAFAKRRRFFAYVQWIAFSQWREAKAYAGSRGVALMGDIPFGVSYYSADVFSHPELFRTGWSGGTPPDKIFKHDLFVQLWGQNWGIPLYDWDAARADGFRWWRQRVRGVRQFFDLFRIDHVLGFYRIYGFPWRPDRNDEFLHLKESEARERTGGVYPGFQPRPDGSSKEKEANRKEGEEYLRVVVEEAGEGRVIGEDLGEVPDYVRPNLTSLGIAGYKIPQWEKRGDGSLIPGETYERLSLTTYGTHDHDPLRMEWDRLSKSDDHGVQSERRALAQYAKVDPDQLPSSLTPELHEALLAALFRSNSWIAIVMITDVFGRAERFNLPGTATSANWTQRVHAPTAELYQEPILPRIRALLQESGRASGVLPEPAGASLTS
jgi:4-alpha-glucanotransferase